MRFVAWIVSTALAAAGALAAPAAVQAAPELVGTYQDWRTFMGDVGGQKVCYAISQPTATSPANVNRDPVFFMVSTYPGRGVIDEPSVAAGYPYRTDSTVTIEIGASRFTAFTRNDGSDGWAWIESPSDEKRLIEAMRAGSEMIVSGTSTRGTLTRDTYSLRGVTAALARAAEGCR